jgi:hypothetical protein
MGGGVDLAGKGGGGGNLADVEGQKVHDIGIIFEAENGDDIVAIQRDGEERRQLLLSLVVCLPTSGLEGL